MTVDIPEPKWRRRKADRPDEILAAALEVFSERGFAAARLEEIARRAGVSKGAIYLYFETKEDLFRAVVRGAVGGPIAHLTSRSAADLAFEDAVRGGLGMLARVIAANPRLGGVVKLIIAESRNLPELATIWHDAVIQPTLTLMTGLVARGQTRGEIRAGDARYFAMGLMGPLLLGVLWRETFEPIGAEAVNIEALVAQHLDTVLKGMKP